LSASRAKSWSTTRSGCSNWAECIKTRSTSGKINSNMDILFYLFAGLMLICGALVVTQRNPVTSAMLLILVFFFMAGLFVLLEAFFLAVIQVLVYAGAVMVLFLFVMMLLDIRPTEKGGRNIAATIAGFTLGFAFLVEFWIVLRRSTLPAP